MCGVPDDLCTGLSGVRWLFGSGMVALWVLVCAPGFFDVRGNARPLFLSPCNNGSQTTSIATNSAPYTCLITTSALALQSQHRNANPAPARSPAQSGGTSQHSSARCADSFEMTHGVAYASCKWLPLCYVNTDVFVSALRAVSGCAGCAVSVCWVCTCVTIAMAG